MSGPTARDAERFWSKVDKSGECWAWTAALTPKGYGKFYYRGRMVFSHRFAWSIGSGAIEGELCVLHRCDTPGCCRPEHLFLGTRQENVADMVSKGRQAKGENSSHPRRLSIDQVQDIRRLVDRPTGVVGHLRSRSEIADLMGVTTSVVAKIMRGEVWKWLPWPENVALPDGWIQP